MIECELLFGSTTCVGRFFRFYIKEGRKKKDLTIFVFNVEDLGIVTVTRSTHH